ncbi:DNA-binding protein Fis [Caulifigura coniformis]|uniref:DNA-binding protein Fis n=1 Tax=Caulifigura coniformis TaxID=2527983 RepID=A0A517SLJ6_9PLAN|nr:helix-turn-helix domain-containing protein [Caulifigura coniformis]QDT56999.1 DNA-binding protein Fis [Caulifigura coniformis]
MKRVIAIVIPFQDDGQSEVAARRGDAGPVTLTADTAFPSLEKGETRIEVVVSDEQAGRILLTVLGDEAKSSNRDLGMQDSPSQLEAAIEQELRDAGPLAHNMLEQIVGRVERQLITDIYKKCDRVKSRAAARLGINRNTLLKKLRQFGEIDEVELERETDPEHPDR